MAKKTAVEKIAEYLPKLAAVSTKQSKVDEMIKLTENETLKAFIIEAEKERTERYAADISYLRQRILYQVMKMAEGKNVTEFQTLAEGFIKVLS